MNKVAYELVAEPVQEQQAEEQQGVEAVEQVEQAPGEVANPTDLQGKPQSITLHLKTMQCFTYFKYCAFIFLGVVWNPSMHVSP